MKKLLAFLFSGLLCMPSLFRADAFGGYTHYYICSRVINDEPDFKNISAEEKLYYISGAAAADLGWWNWDALYPESDKYDFKNMMVEIASKSENLLDKWFALGWSDHVVQDYHTVKTFKSVFENATGTIRYRINCGKLDAYFYDKTGYLSTDKLFIAHDLIGRIYKSLSEEGKIKPGGQISFYPDKILIGKEIWKILWTFYLQSWLGIFGLYEKEIQNLDASIKEICNKCGKNNADFETLFGKREMESVQIFI